MDALDVVAFSGDRLILRFTGGGEGLRDWLELLSSPLELSDEESEDPEVLDDELRGRLGWCLSELFDRFLPESTDRPLARTGVSPRRCLSRRDGLDLFLRILWDELDAASRVGLLLKAPEDESFGFVWRGGVLRIFGGLRS